MQAPLRGKPRRRAEKDEEVEDQSSDEEFERAAPAAAGGAKKPIQITMEDVDAAADIGEAPGDEEDAPRTVYYLYAL